MDAIAISRLLTDEYSTKILLGTLIRPKSAIQLSKENSIPIAACYRRIRCLEEAGLLRCVERTLTRKGKRISVYISLLKNAYIYFENGSLKAKFELADGATVCYDSPPEIPVAPQSI